MITRGVLDKFSLKTGNIGVIIEDDSGNLSTVGDWESHIIANVGLPLDGTPFVINPGGEVIARYRKQYP